jgi:neutral amino acid transport system ATP-binding protein
MSFQLLQWLAQNQSGKTKFYEDSFLWFLVDLLIKLSEYFMLNISNVTKRFGGIVAVSNCSFSVEKKEIISLIGPNGAGKSTLFNCISNIYPIDDGTITFEKTRLDKTPTHKIAKLGISRSFQLTRVLDELSVTENLVLHTAAGFGLNLLLKSITKKDLEKAHDLMNFLGIYHMRNASMSELSYGQKKLLDLGSVLMSNPRLILLDEPAAGVNPRLLETILEKILLLKNQGKTILLVEHNMELVMGISDRVVVMVAGTVLKKGTPQEIQTDDDVLSAYLGSDRK